jgi:hypothetical protein
MWYHVGTPGARVHLANPLTCSVHRFRMRLGFPNIALQRLCESGSALAGRFGDEVPRVVQAQLADLRALPCLADLRMCPWEITEVDDEIHLELPNRHAMRVSSGTPPVPSADWPTVQAVTILGIGVR